MLATALPAWSNDSRTCTIRIEQNSNTSNVCSMHDVYEPALCTNLPNFREISRLKYLNYAGETVDLFLSGWKKFLAATFISCKWPQCPPIRSSIFQAIKHNKAISSVKDIVCTSWFMGCTHYPWVRGKRVIYNGKGVYKNFAELLKASWKGKILHPCLKPSRRVETLTTYCKTHSHPHVIGISFTLRPAQFEQ